jgi:hypothetical protein
MSFGIGRTGLEISILSFEFIECELREMRTLEGLRAESRIESVEQLLEIFATRNRQMFSEMRTLLDLMSPEVHPTEEYREIVVSALREGRRGLRMCLDELDRLRITATACALPKSISEKIEAFGEEAMAIEREAIKFGLEDDEFVDASMDSE